jgi:hypothetical protein
VRLKDLSPGEHHLTIGRIRYYFNDPELRILQAGSPAGLSCETVAELNHLSSGVPVANASVLAKAAKAFPPPCRCTRRMFIPSH